jgi:hypothetical protein
MKYKSAIQELKDAYPHLTYEDGRLWDGDELIEEDANSLIRDHFQDYEIIRPSPDNDPQKETIEKVSGRTYIEIHFYGDYEESFNQI